MSFRKDGSSSISRIRPVRSVRRGTGYDPGPDCEVCGMKRINVVHERDPEHSPEGPAYHSGFAHHWFSVPGGRAEARREP